MKMHRCWSALALVAGTVVCGCSSEPIFKNRPGKTFGEIYVGDVRVSSRERLVNDRLMQDSWLKSQLNNSDSVDFAIQGASDQRSASLTSTRVEANLDQTQLNNYRAQQSMTADALRRQNEQAELDAQLQRQYKQRQLEYMQQQPASSFAYTPPTGAAQTPQSATPPAPPVTVEDLRKLKDDLSKYTITPNPVLVPEKVKQTPQDILRDRLEYRGMIRNEIIENSLDDRHDLKGHTLLRFDLDATVRPHEDTSAWAVVEVSVNRAAMKARCDGELEPRWRDFVENEVEDNALRIMRQAFPSGRASFAKRQGTPAEKAESFVSGMVSSLPDHILFTIQDKWMRDPSSPAISMSNLPRAGRGEPEDRVSRYATASAVVLHKGRISSQGVRRQAADVPLEDYVRALHSEILEAYVQYANDVKIPHVKARLDPSTRRFTLETQGGEEKARVLKSQQRKERSFCDDLFDKVKLYGYGTTPKESAQRISEVASRRNFNEVMLALNFLAGNSAAGKAYFDMIKVNEGIFAALRRQPLAVGINRGADVQASGNARFGWILGPRFGIRDDGQEANLRHTPAFTPLSAVLSLPGWLDEVTLDVNTYWITESGKTDRGSQTNTGGPGTQPDSMPFWMNAGGKQQFEHGPDFPGRTLASTKQLKVRLKPDLSAISEALAGRAFREPRVFLRQHLLFAEGSPAQVTIPGQNLWRSPTVILGGQQAEEVLVLPDMRGIIARFKEIKLPDTPERLTEQVPLTVWTSEGHTDAGLVVIKPLKPVEVTATAALAEPAVVAGKETSIKLSPPQKSFYQMKIWVSASGGTAEEVLISSVADEGGTAKVKIPELKNSKSGERALLQVTIKDAPDNRLPAPHGKAMAGIYYAKEEDTKAKIAPAELILKSLDTPIVLTLPTGSSTIYPDSEGPITVKLTPTPGSPDVDYTTCKLENGKNLKTGQCAIVLSVPKGKEFKADGEYKVEVSARATKIPVTPDVIKVALKEPKSAARKEEPKKDGAKKAAAKK